MTLTAMALNLSKFSNIYFNKSLYSQSQGKPQSSSRDGDRLSETVKQFKDCIRCKVSVKRMNLVGSEYGGESLKEKESMESLDSHLAYLKFINVPSMFDTGGSKADPTSNSLSMSMMDSITFKLVKKEILSRSVGRKLEEIEMLR